MLIKCKAQLTPKGFLRRGYMSHHVTGALHNHEDTIQQTPVIDFMFPECWPTVCAAVPTIRRLRMNVSCLLQVVIGVMREEKGGVGDEYEVTGPYPDQDKR